VMMSTTEPAGGPLRTSVLNRLTLVGMDGNEETGGTAECLAQGVGAIAFRTFRISRVGWPTTPACTAVLPATGPGGRAGASVS